ncbi:MAG TPA: calcium/sodium antiporter [Sphingomicrobium sp.]|nr:calcium/sodium antiporter [Sphingomicrobium sp.]
MAIGLTLLAGLALLVVGGELLVRGSVRVAERLGVSPLLIGLTLVGFGTSTPEIVTSVQAALIGSPGIAVGNIVGSNMANMLLILGASALICPLAVQSRALSRDGVVGLASAALLAAVGWTFGLSRAVGAGFLLMLAAYLYYAFRQERVAAEDHTAAFDRAEAFASADVALRPRAPATTGLRGWLVPLAIAVGGLISIVAGGRLLVSGAVDLARLLGMSEAVIGLTIVAAGTSAPELVTSLVAAVRRQTDVAVGNILGSNIYNLLGIGGLTGIIAPTPVPAQIAAFDSPLMVGASLLLLLFAWTGARLNRAEGGLLLAAYASYVAWLVAG